MPATRPRGDGGAPADDDEVGRDLGAVPTWDGDSAGGGDIEVAALLVLACEET